MNAVSSLILIGVEESDTFTFRATRGFMNTPDGLTEARQYVNMLVEAHPYEAHPLAMVAPLGLMGDVPAELTRDKAVSIGELFPLEPVDSDEAIAALRAKLSGEPQCANEGMGFGECDGPVNRDEGSGEFLCGEHNHGVLACIDAGQGECIGTRSTSIDGQIRCGRHNDRQITRLSRKGN